MAYNRLRGENQRIRLLSESELHMHTYKLVFLGQQNVGKSSLLLRYMKNEYQDNQESTIGAAYLTQSLNVNGTKVKLELWDTAGQERYDCLSQLYYNNAHAAIVIYDISDRETFDRAKSWVKVLNRNASPDIIILLVGNKADLVEGRVINYEEAQEYAESNRLLFMETSAKTAHNVKEIFSILSVKLVKMHAFGRQPSIQLLNGEDDPRCSNCCC